MSIQPVSGPSPQIPIAVVEKFDRVQKLVNEIFEILGKSDRVDWKAQFTASGEYKELSLSPAPQVAAGYVRPDVDAPPSNHYKRMRQPDDMEVVGSSAGQAAVLPDSDPLAHVEEGADWKGAHDALEGQGDQPPSNRVRQVPPALRNVRGIAGLPVLQGEYQNYQEALDSVNRRGAAPPPAAERVYGGSLEYAGAADLVAEPGYGIPAGSHLFPEANRWLEELKEALENKDSSPREIEHIVAHMKEFVLIPEDLNVLYQQLIDDISKGREEMEKERDFLEKVKKATGLHQLLQKALFLSRLFNDDLKALQAKYETKRPQLEKVKEELGRLRRNTEKNAEKRIIYEQYVKLQALRALPE